MAKSSKAASGTRMLKVAHLDGDTLSHGDLYIGEWLDRFQMTPADLARSAELSEGYISALISGKHGANPTLDALRRLGRGIGVPVWALFLPPTEEGLQRHLIRFMASLASRK